MLLLLKKPYIALKNSIAPTFPKIKGQFLSSNTKSNAEKSRHAENAEKSMRGHLNKHNN